MGGKHISMYVRKEEKLAAAYLFVWLERPYLSISGKTLAIIHSCVDCI